MARRPIAASTVALGNGPLPDALPIPYETRLARDSRWALAEGSMHFEQKSAVQEALRKITERLNQLQIDYAVAGGMALFHHGLRRFTEDVGILVTHAGLKAVHHNLEGRGYLPPFTGSKNLRDTDNGVRIEFLIAGEFPGDGKPRPVAFPDPANIHVEREGIDVLPLKDLIEMKLASGISNAGRLRDLADVQDLIRTLQLPIEFANELNPYVRDQFRMLWQGLRDQPAE